MDLLKILSHPAWEGIAAILAILVIILPVIKKIIDSLFFNTHYTIVSNDLYYIKFFLAITLAISFFLPFWCHSQNTCLFANSFFFPIFCSSLTCSTVFNAIISGGFNLFEKFFLIAIFTWAIFFLLFYIYLNKYIKLLLMILEPSFSLGTISFFIVFIINKGFNTIYEEASFGFYVGLSSITVYFIIVLFSGNKAIFFMRIIFISIFLYWLIDLWANILG